MKNINEISINCYGWDKLLTKIYELMNSQKSINLKDLIGITKKYELLKTFQDSEDFKLRTRINLYRYIFGKTFLL